MWGQLFRLSADKGTSLQCQLRQGLVDAILGGKIPPDRPLPSSRELAKHLGIARNTVVLSYQHLVDEGYLCTRERSGYFVNQAILAGMPEPLPVASAGDSSTPDWSAQLKRRPSEQRNIYKPRDWKTYSYPFIYGQPDPQMFPIGDWRECCRQALSVSHVHSVAQDRFDSDDPLLVEQVQTRVLPRRGVWARREEILITVGAQHALYLLAALLLDGTSTVGMEDPGYPDARNIFSMSAGRVLPVPVDGEGIVIDRTLGQCDVVYVTPSHQAPTTVTMSRARRQALLEQAARSGFVLIEDDYESETNFVGDPTPALKSMDSEGRVVYVGSLSKTLAPGLRLGFMVAPEALIREARAMRRLMLRHPPSNNQRIVALFLSLGHHDSLIHRLNGVYRERWEAMSEALGRHMPNSFRTPAFGGTSYWVEGPASLDTRDLQMRGREAGIFMEPGDVYFMQDDAPRNFYRLGFSSISTDRIEPGVRELSTLIDEQIAGGADSGVDHRA